MKKTIILFLLIFFLFSTDLFAETLDCQLSFDLGRATCMAEHRSWRWILLGMGYAVPVWGLNYLGEGGYLGSFGSRFYDSDNARLIAVLAPVLVGFHYPRRGTIPHPVGTEVDLECYKEGYLRIAKLKNAGAVALGEISILVLFFALSEANY